MDRMMMDTLTGKQRRYLRGAGQRLSDSATVGKDGITETFVAHVASLFAAAELLKVRLATEQGAARKVAAEKLAAALEADLIGVVGRTLLLYKPNPEADTPIQFPK
jgi:RNA-binding protein